MPIIPHPFGGGGRAVRGEIAMQNAVVASSSLRKAQSQILPGAVFARRLRLALCSDLRLGVVRAVGRFRSRSILVWGAGCAEAGHAGRYAAPGAPR